MLGARRDAPKVAFTSRGCKQLALTSTATDEGRHRAAEEYNKDKFSTTGPSARNAAWNTWHQLSSFVSRLLSGASFDPVKIAGVLSVFKAGRYRSIGNYCTVAKQMRIAAGHPITDHIEFELASGKRSVARGIVPSHQSAELPLQDIHKVSHPEVPADPSWPLGFMAMIVIACFFVLREVEAALILYTSVLIDDAAKTIYLVTCIEDGSESIDLQAHLGLYL